MPNVHRLRRAFERLYAIRAAANPHTCQPLQAFLALPIQERLVLLLILDGTDPEEIRRLLPYAKQTDARLSSKAILQAAETLKKAIQTPTYWIDPEHDQEKQIRQILYPCAAPMLFGSLVPPEMERLGVQGRLIAYCLVVEELGWEEIMALLGCTEWSIRSSIKNALAELESI